MELVVDAVCRTRHQLQSDAIELGQKLFADHSSIFLAYIEGIWGENPTF